MKSKKKLAIFINSLDHGGAQKIASVLAWELLNEFDVHLVLLKNSIVYDIPSNIKIEILNKGKTGFLDKFKNIFSYYSFCKKNGIDISLSLLTQPNYIATITKLLGTKTKIVLSEHTYQSLWRANERLYSIIKKVIINLLYNRADKIITVSNKIRVDLIKNYGVAEKKVVTIFNPYPIEKINTLSKTKKTALEISNDFTIVTVGTLYHVKNQELLLRAFSRLDQKNVQLIIVGDGELKEYLTNLSKKLQIQDKVNFVGFTDNPFQYVGMSDLFVLSSNNEGLPNVIIEALACGCVVLSTDCTSGPREILAPDTSIDYQLDKSIEFAEFGVLVPVKNEDLMVNAMKALIKDKELLENYRKKSYSRALFFESKNSIKRYTEHLLLN